MARALISSHYSNIRGIDSTSPTLCTYSRCGLEWPIKYINTAAQNGLPVHSVFSFANVTGILECL